LADSTGSPGASSSGQPIPSAGSSGFTPCSRPGAYGVEHRYSTVAWSLTAMNPCPSPSARNSDPRFSLSSRTASHFPNPGDPVRRSTTTSTIAPLTQLTYFACPGGTSE